MFTESQIQAKKDEVRARLLKELEQRMEKAEQEMEELIAKEMIRLHKEAKEAGIEVTSEIKHSWEEQANAYRKRCIEEAAESLEYFINKIAQRELEKELHPIASKLGYIMSGAWFFGK